MSSKYEELEKLADLKQKGIITEEEFNKKKKEILQLDGPEEIPKTDARVESITELPTVNNIQEEVKKAPIWKKSAIGFLILVGFFAFISALFIPDKTDTTKTVDELTQIAQAAPAPLQPTGELVSMFEFGTDYTDVQRENKRKEITGKIIEWTVPVYEVSRDKEGYQIVTKKVAGLFGPDYVVSRIFINARNDEEKRYIESLKTGDMITFKGKIHEVVASGLDRGNLRIKPTILPQFWSQMASSTTEQQKKSSDRLKTSMMPTITLVEGIQQDKDKNEFQVLREAVGDLNNDGISDTVVIYGESPYGGNAFLVNLQIQIGPKDKTKKSPTIELGDRVVVDSVKIKNGTIIVETLKHGPNDPMCCPTVKTTNIYRLTNNKIVLSKNN